MTKITPVMVAIECGNLAVVQELIIKGVDINLADIDGRNVFHYAASCSDPAVIQVCFICCTVQAQLGVVSSKIRNKFEGS